MNAEILETGEAAEKPSPKKRRHPAGGKNKPRVAAPVAPVTAEQVERGVPGEPTAPTPAEFAAGMLLTTATAALLGGGLGPKTAECLDRPACLTAWVGVLRFHDVQMPAWAVAYGAVTEVVARAAVASGALDPVSQAIARFVDRLGVPQAPSEAPAETPAEPPA